MNRLKVLIAVSMFMVLNFSGASYALVGVGIHYSIDMSVKMDAAKEQLTFDNLKLTTDGFSGIPSGWAPTDAINPQNIPIYFDRGKMDRTPFGLGGKIYVDIIPFIDCIELGGDFTAFEYDGKIIYPKNIGILNPTTLTPDQVLAGKSPSLVKIDYDTVSTNLKDIKGAPSVPGITKTPFAKLDLGLTIRKYLRIPAVNHFLRPYYGLGFDMIFATPVPSSGLIRDALGSDLSGNKSIAQIEAIMQGGAAKKVVEKVLDRLMTPHFGMNIIVGFMIKPPLMPLGLYVDGKYGIPFDKLDKDANVTGMGLKFNAGLCLHFGK
jgi:hypothetical protein